jgi:outer membrane biosynthesis protein TonB
MQSPDIYQDDNEQEPSAGAVWLKRIAIVLIAVLVLGLLGYMMKGLFSGSAPGKKAITTIKLLPDTPPPPPPPPKEPPKEQPKDQPKEVKEVPQPKPEQTPPAEVLKMEGAAGDAPSAFAAGAVNNEYKSGDVGTKIGGKKGMGAYAWYTGQIKTRIEDALATDNELSTAQYRIVIHLWLARDGRIERTELQGSSGKPKIDELIKKALAGIAAVSEAPPEDMPQPVKLRITSKNTS